MSEQLLTVAFFSWAQNILHVDTPFQQNHLRLHISPSDVPLYCSTSTSKYSAARHKNLSGVSRRPTGRCPKQSPGFRLAVHLLSCTRLFVHTFTISRDNAQQQSKQSPGCRHQDLIYSETQNSSYFGGKQLPHRKVGTFMHPDHTQPCFAPSLHTSTAHQSLKLGEQTNSDTHRQVTHYWTSWRHQTVSFSGKRGLRVT